ncbi:MAG: TlyA family RNA methyltransferase [Anaerolineales bacterium]|nr:TlyA family RNA methyltransferase [Anaerolineales bacterium]
MALRERADILLTESGLADSRSAAQRLIMAGQLRADGQRVLRPSQRLDRACRLTLDAPAPFVSRGGEKLAAALGCLPIEIGQRTCADIGASTGGFTDCLLQAGAARVYAVDVGQGILHWRLRNDPRVVVMEGINARYLDLLPEPVDLVTLDLSFISLRLVLPRLPGWMRPGGDVVALVKPQFEVGKQAVGRGGVVRGEDDRLQALLSVAEVAAALGIFPQAGLRSPLLGPKGNVEFLLWAVLGGPQIDLQLVLDGVRLAPREEQTDDSGILPAAGERPPGP